MRISLNWLKKFVDVDISDDELVRLIGARLVEVEDVIDETHKYDKIIVARVNSAEKIPGTHLFLCQVFDGEKETQILTGAPNVRAGMLTAWIQPGAIVPMSVHEGAPLVIGTRKMLKKYDSFGMLAGADELDFGDDHSGLVEIDPDMAEPGEPLSEVFELNDKILDIENKSLTHRPDCFGMIGFAREVAGILGKKFKEPRFEELAVSKNAKLDVKILDPSICARYTAVVLKKHGELKKKYLTLEDTLLAKAGMRPVSPIVDATNYLMLLTGQPLHAFDYDKFLAISRESTGRDNPELRVRLARTGEKLTLLDEKEIELNADDIVICAGATPVALAGAMGGESTEIDENTKNIILESATFSLYNLRKTQMSHGIFSEAITRFTKGQPSFQTLKVATMFSEEVAEGFQVSEVVDQKFETAETRNRPIRLKIPQINELLGTSFTKTQIMKTLLNVSFEIRNLRGDEISVLAPAWRTDIHIPEDAIEEIGRLNGFDNIDPTLPLHGTATENSMFELKTEVRNELSRLGANEVLTYSFVSERMLKNAGLDPEKSFKIINSISPELQRIRQSIVPSLLEKTYLNIKIPVDEFALFEMNQVYNKDGELDAEKVPKPKMKLGFVVAKRKDQETAFYLAKKYAFALLIALGVHDVKFTQISKSNSGENVENEDSSKETALDTKILDVLSESDKAFISAEIAPFEEKRAAEIWVGETRLGVVGEFKNSVRKNFKLENFLAGFEIDLEKVLNLERKHVISNDFSPRIKRDVTIESEKSYGEVEAEILTAARKLELAPKISPAGIFQKDGEMKRTTFHLEFAEKSDAEKISELVKKLEG